MRKVSVIAQPERNVEFSIDGQANFAYYALIAQKLTEEETSNAWNWRL